MVSYVAAPSQQDAWISGALIPWLSVITDDTPNVPPRAVASALILINGYATGWGAARPQLLTALQVAVDWKACP